ncbi:NAD(P)-dependent oxidoreductase [Flammeovirgaceae bacterium SG7u.111]|nr:NAD(P)-dependent oxidoreductase [Flammeovirgaceae bacterium SG7u.132]WPO37635.1 NAD(P)-dependent oxidoreductase [Flammeovirgaceae bacterium SG7u.111]
MILVDNALKAREAAGNPIKVGIIGAGAMAKGMINQIAKYTPGMVVAATHARTIEKATTSYDYAGITGYKITNSVSEAEATIAKGKSVITDNIDVLIEAGNIDILVEATGAVEFTARLFLKAMDFGKHILSFNAEIDATLGPILKQKADQAGVMYSVADGDQPGVTLNLYRFVKSMGFTPLVAGNIKGLQDRYRNPTTQASFAKQWQMAPEMVTSFADGTKISIEQACIANATGMKVAQRGMIGHHSKEHIDDLTKLFDVDQLKELGGIVDYVVGPKPGPGVFIYATTDDPLSAHYLKYGKLGDGPLYSFYVPYHLLLFEIPNSISRMVDFKDTILAPIGAPVVEVMTAAKTDLKAGETLDGLGGYKYYGMCENSPVMRAENLLPVGLANGVKLKNDIPKDQAITLDDIIMPEDSLVFDLFHQQLEAFQTQAV